MNCRQADMCSEWASIRKFWLNVFLFLNKCVWRIYSPKEMSRADTLRAPLTARLTPSVMKCLKIFPWRHSKRWQQIHASLHWKPCYQIIWYSIERMWTKVINAWLTLSNYVPAQMLQGLVSSKPAGKSNYSSLCLWIFVWLDNHLPAHDRVQGKSICMKMSPCLLERSRGCTDPNASLNITHMLSTHVQ